MQAVHLSGGALTLGLATALLCAGCAPLPSASQGFLRPSGLHGLRLTLPGLRLTLPGLLPAGALDRLEPEADCLVLASGGEYYRFERNGVDVSGLIPGDPVTVTYSRGSGPGGGHRLRSPALHHQGHALNPGGRIHRWDAAVLLSSSSNFGGPGLRLKALKDHQKALPLQP